MQGNISVEKTQELCYCQCRVKMFIVSALIVCFIFLLVFVLLGFYRTWKIQQSNNQKLFLHGKVPTSLPDGFYKGVVVGYNGPWIGKKFDRAKARGTNIFRKNGKEGEQYPFKTYVAKGLQDKSITVLKIDYNISENPFWVRSILDEVVLVDTDKFLGKITFRLIPNLPFSIGYFQLQKQ